MSDDAVEAFRLKWLRRRITRPPKHSGNQGGGELTPHTRCLPVSKTKMVPKHIAGEKSELSKWQVISHIDWNSAHIYSSFDMIRLGLVFKAQKLFWGLISTYKGFFCCFVVFFFFLHTCSLQVHHHLPKRFSILMRIRNENHHYISSAKQPLSNNPG